MVIANIIPPERKRRLSNRGIPFREIPEIEFTGGMLVKSDEAVAMKGMPNRVKAKHSASTNPSVEVTIGDFTVPSYSSAENGDLVSSYLCFRDVVLPRSSTSRSRRQVPRWPPDCRARRGTSTVSQKTSAPEFGGVFLRVPWNDGSSALSVG
jgi:hypothetical protein